MSLDNDSTVVNSVLTSFSDVNSTEPTMTETVEAVVQEAVKTSENFTDNFTDSFTDSFWSCTKILLYLLLAVFCWEYLALQYEKYMTKRQANNNKDDNEEKYVTKFKPSYVLTVVRDMLKSFFITAGEIVGKFNIVVVDFVKSFWKFITRTWNEFCKLMESLFGDLCTVAGNLLYPAFRICETPIFFFKGYAKTIKEYFVALKAKGSSTSNTKKLLYFVVFVKVMILVYVAYIYKSEILSFLCTTFEYVMTQYFS